MAWGEYAAGICPGGCGQPVAESTSHWTRGPQYDATSVTCRACAARDEAQRAEKDRHPDAHPKLWQVIRTPKAKG